MTTVHPIHQMRQREFAQRLARLPYLRQPSLLGTLEPVKRSLHVVYLLGHVSVCGGVKIILEHANRLTERGHRVTLLSHFDPPDWFSIQAETIKLPFGLELAKGIPPDCDLVVATYWDQIGACIEQASAPVIYFEQGDQHLFANDRLSSSLSSSVQQQYQLPHQVFTVSATSAKLIDQVFHRQAAVFANAVDEAVFYPRHGQPAQPFILAVGGEQSTFKRIPDIWAAYQRLIPKYPDLEFVWVSPTAPENPLGRVVVNPPQSQLGDLYREATIYICASEYESFSLPVLEAMTCGCPVITTPNEGVKAYTRDEENCLYFPTGDIDSLAQAMDRLITDPLLYERLQASGYTTAARFSWRQIIPELETYYREISRRRPPLDVDRQDWLQLPLDFSSDEWDTVAPLLARTAADVVLMPYTFEVFGRRLARWFPAFRRRESSTGLVDLLPTVTRPLQVSDYPYPELMACLIREDLEKAIELCIAELNRSAQAQEMAVLLRWLAWCLQRSRRTPQAVFTLDRALHLNPTFSDLYYLRGTLAAEGDDTTIAHHCLAMAHVLGTAFHYPEFLMI